MSATRPPAGDRSGTARGRGQTAPGADRGVATGSRRDQPPSGQGSGPAGGPDLAMLMEVAEATWPPRSRRESGGWIIREGDGGGKRVSAATLAAGAAAEGQLPPIERAEGAMAALGQTPLFMVRPGETALDAALAARGYRRVDPVRLWLAPVELLTGTPIPPATTFCIWEPLQIMRDIWARGGIGPARLRVMERAAAPKTAILGRTADSPAAAAFVAIHRGVAMVHALEVCPELRRHGMGGWVMRQAAAWARARGADRVAVLCTEANTPANSLYASLGMSPVGGYHYRIRQPGEIA